MGAWTRNASPAADGASVHAIGFCVPRSTFPTGRGRFIGEARCSGGREGVVGVLRELADPPREYLELPEVVNHVALPRSAAAAADRDSGRLPQ